MNINFEHDHARFHIEVGIRHEKKASPIFILKRRKAMSSSSKNEEVGKAIKLADIIKHYILNNLSIAERKLAEEMNDNAIEGKDNLIQHLKDRLRIQQDTITSLRNQIKMLKARKKE
jgi:hypothetical protein